MIFDYTPQPLFAADPAAVHALVDAQPDLTPAERAFMRLALLRDPGAMSELGMQPCAHHCEENDR